MSSAGIDAAFRATTYRVTTPEGDFALRIDRLHPAFDDFLSRQSASPLCSPAAGRRGRSPDVCWGVVTAYNPGVRLSDDENRLRQNRLRERIMASGWLFFPACNLADGGFWPEEPSYLVLHLDEERMARLGSEFCQRAVVCGRRGSAPKLLWL